MAASKGSRMLSTYAQECVTTNLSGSARKQHFLAPIRHVEVRNFTAVCYTTTPNNVRRIMWRMVAMLTYISRDSAVGLATTAASRRPYLGRRRSQIVVLLKRLPWALPDRQNQMFVSLLSSSSWRWSSLLWLLWGLKLSSFHPAMKITHQKISLTGER